MSVSAVTEMPRWVGKLMLFVAFVWVVVLIAVVSGALEGPTSLSSTW